MKRVLIIGPCGSGKSTLACELAPRMGLPLVHMDQLGWQAGWVETEKAELNARLAAAVAEDEWLIEGNYGSTLAPRLERADTVIYLDFPIRLCLGGSCGGSGAIAASPAPICRKAAPNASTSHSSGTS